MTIKKPGQLLCVLVGLLLLAGQALTQAEKSETVDLNKVVAEINGEKIFLKDIKLNIEDGEKLVGSLRKLEGLKGEELQNGIKEIEKECLVRKFKEIVEEKHVRQFGITVSEQELRERLESPFENIEMSYEDYAKKQIFLGNKIAKVLHIWVDTPEKGEVLYRKELAVKTGESAWESAKIPESVWIHYKKHYNTHEKIKESLESLTIEKIRQQGMQFWRKPVLLEKLREKVTSSINISNSELREAYDKKHPGIAYWLIDHFFHMEKGVVEQIIKEIKSGESFDKIYHRYNLWHSPKGGFERERFHSTSLREWNPSRPFPPYAKSLPDLKEGDISEIVEGHLQVRWATGKTLLRLQSVKGEKFYHFFYVREIGRRVPPTFEEIKETLRQQLLPQKKEEAYKNWIKEKMEEADIKVFDERYKEGD